MEASLAQKKKKQETEQEEPSWVEYIKHTKDVFDEWSGSEYAGAASEAAKRNREWERKYPKKK